MVTLDEIRQQFGGLTASDRREELAQMLKRLYDEARASKIVERIIIGGSFASQRPEVAGWQPHDLDVIVVLKSNLDLSALTPSQIALTDRHHLRRKLRPGSSDVELDVYCYIGETPAMLELLRRFQTVRDINKPRGVLEVSIDDD
jgi:hypothetical protein